MHQPLRNGGRWINARGWECARARQLHATALNNNWLPTPVQKRAPTNTQQYNFDKTLNFLGMYPSTCSELYIDGM